MTGDSEALPPRLSFFQQHKNHFIVIAGFIVANFLYIISDNKCPFASVDTCATKFLRANAPKWATQILITAIIFITIIIKGINRKISRLYSLAAIVNIIYLCFFYNPVLNSQEYGQVFGFFLGIYVILICLFLTIWSLLTTCYKTSRAGTLIGIPLFLFICFAIFYFTHIYNNCVNWPKGIGNEQIQHDQPTCKVVEPPTCAYDITDGWLDFSRFIKCSSYSSKKDIMEKYYPTHAPYVGFSRTEKFNETERWTLQPYIYDKLVFLDNLNDPEAKDLEIFLDKTSEEHPKIVINVKKNETLVKERSKIQKESLVKNVIVVYIDALSRAGALRKLKKTMSWFDSKTGQQDPDLEAFQFFKYHSITPYTTNNLYEALFGVMPVEPEAAAGKPRKESFLKTFKENGFITGHATDFCQVSPLDMGPGQNIKDEPYDHEGISFACDPHFHDPVSAYSIFNGPYSSVRRCLYGKDLAEDVFDYGNQFWRSYQNEKKILYLDFLDAHEGTGEVVKYMDGYLHDFLSGLERDSLLEDTAVMLFSDHGLHMQGIFYLMGLDVVLIEIALPTLFLAFPKDVADKYRNDLKANEQKLVYSHDIHDMFLTMAEGKESKKLQSSLVGPLSPTRTCDDVLVSTQMICACHYDQN